MRGLHRRVPIAPISTGLFTLLYLTGFVSIETTVLVLLIGMALNQLSTWFLDREVADMEWCDCEDHDDGTEAEEDQPRRIY